MEVLERLYVVSKVTCISKKWVYYIKKKVKELIINTKPDGTRIVLLESGEIVEYQKEKKEGGYNVGDIYLGTVKEVVVGLNAAFIDIGYHQEAFLSYSDIEFNFQSSQKVINTCIRDRKRIEMKKVTLVKSLKKTSSISDALKKGDKVLVRIVKEPTASKPLRVSSILSLAGRYLVLIPFENDIKFSKRLLFRKEKMRLQSLVRSIRPNNYTLLVRREASGKTLPDLETDLKKLLDKWEKGLGKLYKIASGDRVIGEVSRVSLLVRETLNSGLSKIIVDNKDLKSELASYIKSIEPEKEKIVEIYKGRTPIFEHFDIERQLKRLFSREVELPGGGSLVMEKTEAMYVIDVNSSSHVNKKQDDKTMALQVNLDAVKEISRQLKLRNLGGMIVVDFISMSHPEDRKKVYIAMKEYVKNSSTKINIFPLTRLGLMQITRERKRALVKELINVKKCLLCNGSGKSVGDLDIVEKIEDSIKMLLDNHKVSKLEIQVHPLLFTYFSSGWFPIKWRWVWKYKSFIRLKKESEKSIDFCRLLFFNEEKKAIVLEL